jgi:hypothetical protein
MATERIVKTRKGYLVIHPTMETVLLAAIFDSHVPRGPARRMRRIDASTAENVLWMQRTGAEAAP